MISLATEFTELNRKQTSLLLSEALQPFQTNIHLTFQRMAIITSPLLTLPETNQHLPKKYRLLIAKRKKARSYQLRAFYSLVSSSTGKFNSQVFNTRRMIFPLLVFGSLSRNSISCGTAWLDKFFFINNLISSSNSGLPL